MGAENAGHAAARRTKSRSNPSTTTMKSIRTRLFLLLLLLVLFPLRAGADIPEAVWHWDAAAWLAKYNHDQFSASPVTTSDGGTGARIAVTPRDALNPYNHIVVSGANLKGGNLYTAIISFSVIEPTTYPTSFYMFARNSAGEQYDIWQTWIGLPGPSRTITLPLDLKDIPGGTWRLHMGISKSGAILIDSLAVYRGLTSDGKVVFATQPAVAGGHPASELPAGLNAATGFTPFTIAPPAETKGSVITLATYHFVADVPGAAAAVAVSNAAAFQQAINDCKAQGASKLVVPAGTYRLASPTAIAFTGLADLTVEGNGAQFIIEKLTKDGPAFLINNCTRVCFENFSLDWDWASIPIASLATISHISPDKLQCDFTFPDLDATQTQLTRTTPWHGIFGMDATRLVVNDNLRFSVPKDIVLATGGAGNSIHAAFPRPIPFKEGGSYCVRHLYYEMAGFKIVEDQDLLFKGVNIYSIPGMGWFFAGAMKNFGLIDCHILRAPGSRHPLTTAADGVHVDQSMGNALFQNCSITGTGDDEFNIHSECYQGNLVADPTDPAKVTLENCPSYQLRLKPGDSVQIFNADFSNLGDAPTPVSRQIAQVNSDNKIKKTAIQFTEALPPGVTPQSIVLNARLITRNVLIADCNIEHSNGRGILLSAEDASITGCHFRDLFGTPIDLESEIIQPLWTEGRGTSNVVIKGNTFEDCSLIWGRYGGAIIYTNTRIPWGPTTTALYHRITIEENRFINCAGPAASLTNTDNLLIRENQIHQTEAMVNSTTYAGSIFVTRSSGLALGGNTWTVASPATTLSGVVYDPATTHDISFGTNAVTGPTGETAKK